MDTFIFLVCLMLRPPRYDHVHVEVVPGQLIGFVGGKFYAKSFMVQVGELLNLLLVWHGHAPEAKQVDSLRGFGDWLRVRHLRSAYLLHGCPAHLQVFHPKPMIEL